MSAEKKRIPKRRFKEFLNAGDWEQRKLSHLGTIVTGSTPSTAEKKYYTEAGIPWVTPTDISESITFYSAKYLSVEGQKVARIVPQNSILVTCIASIGKNTMLGTVGSFNQQINALVPNEVDNDPFFLFTLSAKWSEKMKQMAASGTMQIVNKSEFSELVTLVASKDEQKLIGRFFSELELSITLHQRKLEKLQNIKKAYLNEMFI